MLGQSEAIGEPTLGTDGFEGDHMPPAVSGNGTEEGDHALGLESSGPGEFVPEYRGLNLSGHMPIYERVAGYNRARCEKGKRRQLLVTHASPSGVVSSSFLPSFLPSFSDSA